MGEGFSVLQGTKTQSSLYGLQVFVTQQGGKRPGQMASNGCEYSFLLPGWEALLHEVFPKRSLARV